MSFTGGGTIGSDLLNAAEKAAPISKSRQRRTDSLRTIAHAETVESCVMSRDHLVDPAISLIGQLRGNGIGQIVIAHAIRIRSRIELNKCAAEGIDTGSGNHIARRAIDIAKRNAAESAASLTRTRLSEASIEKFSLIGRNSIAVGDTCGRGKIQLAREVAALLGEGWNQRSGSLRLAETQSFVIDKKQQLVSNDLSA